MSGRITQFCQNPAADHWVLTNRVVDAFATVMQGRSYSHHEGIGQCSGVDSTELEPDTCRMSRGSITILVLIR